MYCAVITWLILSNYWIKVFSNMFFVKTNTTFCRITANERELFIQFHHTYLRRSDRLYSYGSRGLDSGWGAFTTCGTSLGHPERGLRPLRPLIPVIDLNLVEHWWVSMVIALLGWVVCLLCLVIAL